MVPSVCSLEAREQIVGVYRSSPMLFKDLLVKLEELGSWVLLSGRALSAMDASRDIPHNREHRLPHRLHLPFPRFTV